MSPRDHRPESPSTARVRSTRLGKAVEKAGKQLRKIAFYARGALLPVTPGRVYRARRERALALDRIDHPAAALARVDYCNRLEEPFELPPDAIRIGDFTWDESAAYSIDLWRLLKYFPPDLRIAYRFGDVREVPAAPRIVKSRPIGDANAHGVLLKLNTVRHYYTRRDPLDFEEKIPAAVWRGAALTPWREEFVARLRDHPLCDVGHTNREGRAGHQPFMTVRDQLRYRYVLSVEGNDVATNLKWIMASNSLCLMRRPRFETWFMEGTLEPGTHYVELRDDYADVGDKIRYYDAHPDEAKRIIRGANRHVARFFDARRERLISLRVLQKYFELSGQL